MSKIAEDTEKVENFSDSEKTEQTPSSNMELIDNVWVYTDQNTGSKFTHDGQNWIPFRTVMPETDDACNVKWINGRWIHTNIESSQKRYFDENTKQWVDFIEKDDAVEKGDLDELEYQLQQEEIERKRLENITENSRVYTDPKDGLQYEWNGEKKAWFPLIDDDFLAKYQANYGQYTAVDDEQAERTSASCGESTQKSEKQLEAEKLATMSSEQRKDYLKRQKREKRRLAAEQEKHRGWVDLSDEKNCNVYVDGLPFDITDQEFEDLMGKCGVIQKDARTNKSKIKLYKDEDGNSKGDGRCCYVKHESVNLALQILDGSLLKGRKISVEVAHFEQKGEYDPKKKQRKLTAHQKKRWLEKQQHIFDWRPERLSHVRPKSDCTVVIANCFTIDELNENPTTLFDLKTELLTECSKYGTVKRVVVYDNNSDGVVGVSFETVEMADDCVTMMNYRMFHSRQLTAKLWDGRTKYVKSEIDEEKKKRLQIWEGFLHESDSKKTDDN